MADAKIISVNPSQKTIGEILNPAVKQREIPHYDVLHEEQDQDSLIDFLFPVRRVGFGKSIVMLFVRLVFASLLFYMGFTTRAVGMPVYLMIAVGTMLTIGLFNRPVMILSATLSTFMSLHSFDSVVDMFVLTSAILSFAICVAGPGWFSADAFINRGLRRYMRHRRRNYKQNHVLA